ncbi:hypothetical protein [Limosilactobacillus reuteri]|uniref:hypothetical protein n=1 Tax=Limosilactobacillus reuteri TaxID=1598 RepID=UPI001E387804|nr:hypothetical protein [Limosilactobacillus reuteri]MCC4359387.1 hypothetical protein [Limosilactobacillus reuteri]MCC4363520.1 hypothetical protein [Limosilactobacillus reuteri]MCC4365384.1 hypothetical protein [Limosilactobacillus reuteri]
MKKINIFNLSILGYLYLPIVLFLITWLNPIIGLPLVLVICYIVLRYSFQKSKMNISLKKDWLFLLVALLIIVLWALLSGLGGFFLQSYDWQKHNVLLNDFINKNWPVHYKFNGKYGVVSYYIGEYIIPGMIGKVYGFNVAQTSLLVWMILGLFLLILSLYKWVNKQNGYLFLLIVFALILFSPFIYPLNGIYGNWVPWDYNTMGEMGEWFSKSLKLQYTSNISLLRFVFPQFVPVALSVSLWLRNRKNYQFWGLILAPTILYSTFTFIGLAVLMLFILIYDCFDKKNAVDWKKVFNIVNILSLLLMIVLLLYISCNIFQPKPVDEKMKFTFIDVWSHKLGFITLQASWFIWVLLLLKHEWKNPLIYASSIILFLLPFCEYGAANDLVMRVSIPALMVINFLVIKNIANYWKKDLYFALVLFGALFIAGIGPLWQLKNASFSHNFHSRVYNMPYKTGDEFFKSDKNVVYQYVDWSQNTLRKIIIRK